VEAVNVAKNGLLHAGCGDGKRQHYSPRLEEG
jgi:hypothetical protein